MSNNLYLTNQDQLEHKEITHLIKDDKNNESVIAESQAKYRLEQISHWKQEAQKYIDRRICLVRQAQIFYIAETNFKNSKLREHKFLYLISKNWIENWKQYTKYEQIIKNEKLPLQLETKQQRLVQLNRDIVDESYYPSMKFSEDSRLEFYNLNLKPNLRENKDILYLDARMWNTFAKYQGVEIKRQVIELQNNQSIVDLYPLKITLIIISNRMMKQMATKKKFAPVQQTINFSKYHTFAFFSLNLKELIIKTLLLKHEENLDQIKYNDQNMRFLYVESTYTTQKVTRRLMSTVIAQENSSQFSFFITHRVLDNSQTLQKQIVTSQPIIICEILQQKQDQLLRMCYDSKSLAFLKCPTCHKLNNLGTFCKCQKIAYCSLQCKEQDIKHINFCKRQMMHTEKNNCFQFIKKKNGLVGLINLGNTCFMNSGIQCLSHVYELTSYFLSGQFSNHINKENALGTRGNLSNSYCNMIKNLWEQQAIAYSPADFKKNVSFFQKMFSGYHQHDSGQFITYLLDGLHEDLNRTKSKTYIQSKEIDDRPEKTIADQQWNSFVLRNNSKIVELMYGQYRSQVDCPKCKYKSLQFEAFLMCSLPIVEPNLRISIIFQNEQTFEETVENYVYQEKETKMLDILKKMKSQKCQEGDKILFYIGKTQIDLNQTVSNIKLKYKNSNIFARKMSRFQSENGNKFFVIFKSKQKNQKGELENVTFAMKLFKFKSNLTNAEVYKSLYEVHKNLFNLGNFEEIIMKEPRQRRVKIYVEVGQNSPCWVCNLGFKCKGCSFPYTNDQISNIFSKRAIVPLKIIIHSEAQKPYLKKNKILAEPLPVSNLIDCFSAFQKPQTLTADNSWRCPRCKQLWPAKKQMMIYKSPKILILCLKRFKKRNYTTQKNHTYVQFPISGLDLTNIVVSKELPQLEPKQFSQQPQKVLYDLFAVSYHIGEAGSGHYTAACKNPGKNIWYQFDDQNVTRINEQKIVNKHAYLLFYRRR